MKQDFIYSGTVLMVENLSVKIGEKTIIEDINFEEKNVVKQGQEQGQMIAIVGRSGRGKSTLFKAITGLRAPTTGKILIPSEKANNPKEVKEGEVGFVDQKYTLFRHLSVINQLKLAAQKGGIDAAEIVDKVNDLLEKWGLDKIKNQYPNHCSGGQRQRVAILCQILSSGYFLVLDEPFSGLDVGNVEDLKQMLVKINQSNDLSTIIFSTHDIELAVELADKIYVIGYKNLDNHVGTIVASYCLKELGLAWQPYGAEHSALVKEIKKKILAS